MKMMESQDIEMMIVVPIKSAVANINLKN